VLRSAAYASFCVKSKVSIVRSLKREAYQGRNKEEMVVEYVTTLGLAVCFFLATKVVYRYVGTSESLTMG
jgi:hypothetical protein